MAGKGKKNRFRSPAVSAVLFAAAAVLLLIGTVGGAQAALSYTSQTYQSRVRMSKMGVTLLENGEAVSWRNYAENDEGWSGESGSLLANLLGEKEAFQPGRIYDERLSVSNSGEIDQYVRVTVYKYWTDKDGNTKQVDLSPDLIRLHLLTDSEGSPWLVDTEASTKERTVLYYKNVLEPGASVDFSDSLQIDPAVVSMVTTENTDGALTVSYAYDGVQFWVRAEADAVQTHNGEDAIWSAWGRRLTVEEDGTLSLQKPGGND